MSNSNQVENSAQPEHPVVTATTRHAPGRVAVTDSTPFKKKYGPDLTFASEYKNFERVRSHLGHEMNGRWLGPMPVDEFLDEFLRPADIPLPGLLENPFVDVPDVGTESARYGPFITAIQGWIPHLRAVNTSTKEDTENKLKLKADISFYDHTKGVTPPERTDFSQMELWMEFKTKSTGVAFQDPPNSEEEDSRKLAIEHGTFTPDTVDGINGRGQLAHYAGAQHSMQFRHFSFSIAIDGNHARFLRWDPAGTIVTAAFNYRTNPRSMAKFLWRFDHLSAGERGHDESVQPANLPHEVAARVREKLDIKNNDTLLYRYTVPGLNGRGYAYGPRPPTQNRSLVSRCTRSLPVLWIPSVDIDEKGNLCTDSCVSGERDGDGVNKSEPWCEEGIIYMKDTWRFLSDSPGIQILPEHEIYDILHEHKTPNIPEHVAGGDVDGGKTRTQEFVGAVWLCVKPRISPFHHYRLVHGIVGRALFKFECTKQLVVAVLDALKAHWHAFEHAKILHRDISAGNIIMTSGGRGLLIDWELAKNVNEVGSRRPDRTGTWQFMSANLLRNPGKMHAFTDDLESFLHVVAWMTLRYVPAFENYRPTHRGRDMAMFDEHYRSGEHDEGGEYKYNILAAGHYPSSHFQPRQATPLSALLTNLSKPFKSFYGAKPPTAEDRKKITVPPNISDAELGELYFMIRRYDQDIQRLESSRWFIEEMDKALEEKVWPTDDKADSSLLIASLAGHTDNRVRIKTGQLQHTHSLWENSKGLSRGSKRTASPTAKPSSKRRRHSPATSEHQV